MPTNEQNGKARAAELMSQFKGAGYEERDARIQSLAERGKKINRSMHQNLADTHKMIYGATADDPLDLDSDASSDDWRKEEIYLTDDGKEVIEKKYRLIDGHLAYITYRKNLNEIDSYLLLQLQEQQEKKSGKKGKQVERAHNAPNLSKNTDPTTPYSSLWLDELKLDPEVSRWREGYKQEKHNSDHAFEDEELDVWLKLADEFEREDKDKSRL
ncbi:hypothetical protein GQX73_g7225 [Xylaria multiplex]|uniref:Uncharacterized protein n=1 Tax=Xylaria multiplex TaxID=323545 RepID=A0A7C8IQC0_9PEZI|nr:hypothetical protein GQX73_g7225 [Xylaria multiplex]